MKCYCRTQICKEMPALEVAIFSRKDKLSLERESYIISWTLESTTVSLCNSGTTHWLAWCRISPMLHSSVWSISTPQSSDSDDSINKHTWYLGICLGYWKMWGTIVLIWHAIWIWVLWCKYHEWLLNTPKLNARVNFCCAKRMCIK